MKKTMIFIISILLIISSLSVVCKKKKKIAVATGNNSNNVIIKDDPEITNKTAEKNTGNIPLETDPVTTNAYQYAENLKNTSATTTTTELTNSENVTHNNIINPNNDKKIYMNATFVSDVPEAVENNILISVYNKDTNETFDFSLPKNNRFFLMVELPIGNYVYTKMDTGEVLTRYQCQKHRLVEQGFDASLSEEQIMKQRGFNKIYDCGNAVYVYEPTN